MPELTQRCPRCKQKLTEKFYYPSIWQKSGRCISCCKKDSKKYYSSNRQRLLDKSKEYRITHKKQRLEYRIKHKVRANELAKIRRILNIEDYLEKSRARNFKSYHKNKETKRMYYLKMRAAYEFVKRQEAKLERQLKLLQKEIRP